MSSMDLGTLFVRIGADVTAFTAGLSGALDRVSSFAKEAKKLSNEVAGFAGAFVGLGAAATALASTVDGPTASAVADLRKEGELLAVQVSRALLPAIRELAQWLRSAAEAFAGLSPETRAAIADWGLMAVKVSLGAKALGTALSLVDEVSGAAANVLKAVAAAGLGPVLAVTAAVAALAAGVLLLHRAWRKNWGDIQGLTAKVASWLKGAFSSVGGAIYDALVFPVVKFLDVVLTAVEAVAALNRALGRDDMPFVEGLRDAVAGLKKDVQTGDVFRAAFDFAGDVASSIGAAASEEIDAIGAELKGVFKLGAKGKAAAPVAVNLDVSPIGDAGQNEVKAWADGAMASLGTTLRAVAEITDPRHVNMTKVAAAMRSGSTALLNMWELAIATADDLSKRWAELARTQQTAGNWAGRMSSTLEQATGAIGGLVKTIMDGVAAGGVIGGIVAGAVSLAQRMGSFQHAMAIVDTALTRAAKSLEVVLGPVFAVVERVIVQVFNALDRVFAAIAPVFAVVESVLMSTVVPAFVELGYAFRFLQPLLSMLASTVAALMRPILAIVSFGLLTDALFYALKIVVSVLGVAVGGIAAVVSKIVQALAWLWDGLGQVIFAIGDLVSKINGDLGNRIRAVGLDMRGAAIGMRESIPNMDQYWKDLAAFWEMTPEQARAQAEADMAAWKAGDSLGELATSAAAVTEALTNVPSGYRVALARFEASMPDALGWTPGSSGVPDGSWSRSGSTARSLPFADSGASNVFGWAGARDGVVVYGDINIQADSTDDAYSIAAEVAGEAALAVAQRTGTTAIRPRPFGGG